MSRFLTLSKGISGAAEVSSLLGSGVYHLNVIQQRLTTSFKPDDILVGWGQKANTLKARNLAEQHDLPYWSLEDGFISYLGHPALGDKRFALIVDKTGIYYDGTQPSDIENLLNKTDAISPELTARTAALLKTIRQHQISKYNHEPVTSFQRLASSGQYDGGFQRLATSGQHENGGVSECTTGSWQPGAGSQNRVLVVDQTYGDCSVKFGMADDSSFKAMLEAALSENPDAEIWVKVHPDVVLGKKKGYFDEFLATSGELPATSSATGSWQPKAGSRVRILSEKVNAQSLFPHFDKVYVVTSQLGFEALWYGKEVVCFGLPFYSGWGLTDDRVACSRRTQTHTIESLFAAACLQYTRYIDPETGERCELEDVIELIALQRQYQTPQVETLYAVGFSLWKRAFMRNFISGSANQVTFVKHLDKAASLAKSGDGILLWGAKSALAASCQLSAAGSQKLEADSQIPEADSRKPEARVWRAEDAFIRSVGLGAELRRPGSMIIDKQGIYFDCTRSSDLEVAVNTLSLSQDQIQRGQALRKLLVSQRISKYNLSGTSQPIFNKARPEQLKILITGQVDSDASLQWGSPEVTSNLSLLQQVRQANPEAYIVYKPHPDVIIAGRPGYIAEDTALRWADKIACDGDIFDCISQCEEVHLMTSLAGFEALTQGKPVHCWGMPFYAGWGLTVDHMSCERRQAKRTLDEMVWFAHCYYPRYINWKTRRFTTPERMIRAIAAEPKVTHSTQNRLTGWLFRTKRKATYLLEALREQQFR